MRFSGLLLLIFSLWVQTSTGKTTGLNAHSVIQFTKESGKAAEFSHFFYEIGDSLAASDPDSVSTQARKPKKRRLKAALLSVLLGHFGVHRIYLGTAAEVPVAYSLTLGGGLGLLPLIDAIAILSTKDLNEFSNNDRVIMWSKPK